MVKGIDISHWNKVDWAKISQDFVIMKASEGINWVDSQFEINQKSAREKGILCGFYHFADGLNAKHEADFFVQTVGPLKTGEFLVLDWEINHPAAVDWCKKFLDRVYEKTGVRPLLYTNEARVKSLNWKPVVDGNYGLWVAKYGLNLDWMGMPPTSGAWPFWVLWQYTSRGSVKGVTGNVDKNYGKLSLEQLKKYGKQPVCSNCCPIHCNGK